MNVRPAHQKVFLVLVVKISDYFSILLKNALKSLKTVVFHFALQRFRIFRQNEDRNRAFYSDDEQIGQPVTLAQQIYYKISHNQTNWSYAVAGCEIQKSGLVVMD